MDNHTKEQRSKNMKKIRSKDTEIEIILRKRLWNKGFRYRKNYSKLPGKPDIAITKYRIAVFCDSEFFHGKNWKEQEQRVLRGENSNYWLKKIERNIQRDIEVNRELKELGWTVLRFWGKDIKKDTDNCIKTIEEAVLEFILES